MADVKTVERGVVVKLEYTLLIDEEMVESTDDEGPIEFLQGFGEIIPGLEDALYGMRVGQEKRMATASMTTRRLRKCRWRSSPTIWT